MSKLKSLLPGTLVLSALVLLFLFTGLPSFSPATVDLGFEEIILAKSADDIAQPLESNPAGGFMRITGRGLDIAPPRFTVQPVVTLPDIEGSEGAMAFALLSVLSGIVCLAKKK
ncbi:MAG: hypothetical protein HYS18_10075 [Burkholderiales bacterium]|nr:hypothetical protein [Burkholderiales bacterium]